MINNKDNWLKETVFGIEDGMVSTLGALSGIAIGSQNQNIILMAGIVVIVVESVSMTVGSYLSNQAIRDMYMLRIEEEKKYVRRKFDDEKKELLAIYVSQGWPDKFAQTMVSKAAMNKKLFFKEMICHELGLKNFAWRKIDRSYLGMLVGYIIGGLIPLISYLIWPWQQAWWLSIGLTLIGLFILGLLISKLTNNKWWKNGLRVLFFGGVALIFGLLAGYISRRYL